MDTSHDIALGVPDNRPDPYLDMGRSAGTFLTPDTDTVCSLIQPILPIHNGVEQEPG